MKKRLWAVLLTICLVAALLPTTTLAADPVLQGYCGGDANAEKVTWELVQNNEGSSNPTYTLAISGTGAMADYSGNNRPTWYNSKESITKIVVVNGVTVIGDAAFSGCDNVTSVSLPEGLTSIGSYAFECSKDSAPKLTAITFPSTLTTVKEFAFLRSALTTVNLPNSVTTIQKGTFKFCTALTSITAKGVTSIGDQAFQGCSTLTTVQMAEITSLGANAFNSCSALTVLPIAEGITEIPNSAFEHCTALTSIVIPSSVKSIGNKAFNGCTSLTSVTLPASIEKLGSSKNAAFSNKATFILVGSGAVDAHPSNNSAWATGIWSINKVAIEKIIVSEGITSIGTNAFRGLENLKYVELPSTVTHIGDYAFYNDTALIAVDMSKISSISFDQNDVVQQEQSNFSIYVFSQDIATEISSKCTDQTKNNLFLGVVNGGTFPADKTFESGKLATPIKDGCIFDGWYTDKACTQNLTGTPTANSTYYAKWSEIIAAVGGTKYASLADAVAAANGKTIKLLKDVTENVTIPAGKTITLDLNGKNIEVTSGCAIVNKGTLTVTGSGNVKTSAASSAAVANFPDATANLNGGTYSSDDWYVIKNMGTMVIDGPVTVKKPDNSTNTASLIDNGWVGNSDSVAGESVAAQAGKAKLTIKNDAFEGISGPASCAVVKNDDYGVLEITGGNFDSTKNTGTSNAATILNWNVATISGGTFKGSYPISNGSYDNEADQGKLTITGGNFIGTSSLLGQAQGGTPNTGKLTITDGSFNAPQFGAFDYALEISGGSFSQSVKKEYLDSSLNAELKRASGETPYSYYTDVAAAAAAAQPGDTVTDLSAQSGTFTLTLKYNDGATADITYNVASGTSIPLPTPTRSGYIFRGWALNGTAISGTAYTVTEDTTLTAIWESPNTGYSEQVKKQSEEFEAKKRGELPESDSAFRDVAEDDYFFDAVNWAAENGVASGVSSTRFGPGLDCTRGQTMTFLWRAMGEPEPDSLASSLTDVMSGSYYYKAVLWAMQEGVTTGVGKNVFAPDTTVTRGQFVTFLYRLAGASGSGEHPFTDVPAGSYYEAAIAWAYSEGITTGTSSTTFSPDAPCTRAQIITFLYRYFGK